MPVSRRLIGAVLLALLIAAVPARADWRGDYALEPGFAVERDVTGLHLPSAIAFVPIPGDGPKDPLYFVTEMRGTIKVVTNDRTVYTFAEGFFDLKPQRELPAQLGEIGMAGICLDAEHGYVFVSYAWEDEHGIYRNGITRFDTQPGVFAIKPTATKRLAPMLDGYFSAVSHQIGPLAIVGGHLLVSVGDAEITTSSRDPDQPTGKLLRMTLDGEPAPDNPFAVDADAGKPRNYVWAMGLRNPFSLAAIGQRVYVADNGPSVDRLVEARAGDDFMYDGSDESFAANALYVWPHAVSPVQMRYDGGRAESLGWPEAWRSAFYLALSGSPLDPPGPGRYSKRIIALGYDEPTGRITATPRTLLRYVGPGTQLIAGVAFGPDGLYVVPIMPDADGQTAVLRVTYDPAKAPAESATGGGRIDNLFQRYKCHACHVIDGDGFGHVGPAIERASLVDTLLARLNSPAYAEQLRQVDALDSEPFNRFRDVRDALRQAEGAEKVRLWLRNRLIEPRFDRIVALMPNLGMSEQEADRFTAWLMETETGGADLAGIARSLLPEPTRRNMIALATGAAAVGLLIGMAVVPVLRWVLRRVRRGGGAAG